MFGQEQFEVIFRIHKVNARYDSCKCSLARPPTHSPTHPPTHPPTHSIPPTHPRTHPPTHPPTHSIPPTHSFAIFQAEQKVRQTMLEPIFQAVDWVDVGLPQGIYFATGAFFVDIKSIKQRDHSVPPLTLLPGPQATKIPQTYKWHLYTVKSLRVMLFTSLCKANRVNVWIWWDWMHAFRSTLHNHLPKLLTTYINSGPCKCTRFTHVDCSFHITI